MAKTTKAKALTEVEILAPEEAQGVQLSTIAEIGVSTGDVVTIAVSEFEARVEAEINEGSRIIAEIDQELSEHRRDLLDKLVEAMHKHESDVVTTGKPFYEARGLTFGADKSLVYAEERDTESFGIKYTLYSKRSKYTGYSYRDDKPEWSYQDEITYTDTMTFEEAGVLDQVRAIQDLRKARANAVRVQTEWRQRLSNIISVERQTRAELAKAMLNQTDDGKKLTAAIMANFEGRFFRNVSRYKDTPLLGHRTK